MFQTCLSHDHRKFVKPCCKWRGGFRSVGSWNSPLLFGFFIFSAPSSPISHPICHLIWAQIPTEHLASRFRRQNAQEYQVANSRQFLESMCVQRCTKCVLLYSHCHFYSQTFSSNDLMDRFHHLVHLPWPLILPSKGCTSQAAFATSSKGSQMTTFPGGSTARTAATPDTPRKEGRLCCQLPLKLTCRKVPETCKFQSSKT